MCHISTQTSFSWSLKPNKNTFTYQTGSVKYHMTFIDIDVLFHPFIVFDDISTLFLVNVLI